MSRWKKRVIDSLDVLFGRVNVCDLATGPTVPIETPSADTAPVIESVDSIVSQYYKDILWAHSAGLDWELIAERMGLDVSRGFDLGVAFEKEYEKRRTDHVRK